MLRVLRLLVMRIVRGRPRLLWLWVLLLGTLLLPRASSMLLVGLLLLLLLESVEFAPSRFSV